MPTELHSGHGGPSMILLSTFEKTKTKFCPFDDCQGVVMAIRNHYLQTIASDECAHQGLSIDAYNVCVARPVESSNNSGLRTKLHLFPTFILYCQSLSGDTDECQ